jgi:uncharacterized protein
MRRLLPLSLVVFASLIACKSEAPVNAKTDAKPDAQADAQPEQGGEPTLGQWVGKLSLPGDQSLEWALSVQADPDGDGVALAKLWIPAQMVSGVPLGPPVVAANGSMKVQLAAVGASWTILPGAAPTCSFSQGGADIPCTITSSDPTDFAAIAEPARPQTPKPPFPYAIEQLEIQNGDAPGVSLAATLTVPAGDGPHPVVVMITGSGLQDRDETIANHKPFWVIADHLSRNGIAVLRYDDRGYGESRGDPANATLEDFASDAWAAAVAVAKRPEIDGDRLGLVGHSEGGVIAPLLAAEHPEQIDFIVLLAGTGVTGSEVILRQQRLIMEASKIDAAEIEAADAAGRKLHAAVLENSAEAAPAALEKLLRAAMEEQVEQVEQAAAGKPSQEQLDAAIKAQIETLNSAWFRHFLAWDPAPVLAKLKLPVLVVLGDMDLQVDAEQNLAPMQAALAKNPAAEFVLLPGLNHLFQAAQTGLPDEYATIETTIEPEVLEELARWIRVTTKLD